MSLSLRSFRHRREYVGPLRAVIFDWAGTTLDFGCLAPALAFVEVYKRYGVEVSLDEARVPMGAHKKVHLRKLGQLPRVAAAWREVHGHAQDEGDIERMFEDFVPLQLTILPRHCELIHGTLEVVAEIRRRGLRIGSTTGYTLAMNQLLSEEATARGYTPDVTVCADEVPEARPAPWMCLENAKRLGVYPMSAIVKIGDTVPDMIEGLDAGMWAIGLAVTGNEIGLSEEALAALPEDEREARRARAYQRLYAAGAHYVVDGIWDVPPLLDAIDARLRGGERP